jgi:cell division control protein 12
MKRLGTRVNLIPVIAKADTLTQSDLFTFKQRVRPYSYLTLPNVQPDMSTCYPQIRDVVEAQNIRIYQPPVETDDEASAEHARILAEAMPFSIIGSTEDVQTPDGRVVKGREYLWGVAEGV